MKDRKHIELMAQLEKVRDRQINDMDDMTGIVIRDARERDKRRKEDELILKKCKTVLEEVKGIKVEIKKILEEIKKG